MMVHHDAPCRPQRLRNVFEPASFGAELRWSRWLVAGLLIADLATYPLIGGAPDWTDLLRLAATLTTMWVPPVGIPAVFLLSLATPLVGLSTFTIWTYLVPPFAAGLNRRKWLILLALSGPLLANAYVAVQISSAWQLANAILALGACAVGLVARHIYDRSQADENDLSELIGEQRRIRSQERTVLASELDTLMAAHLGAFASDLERRADDQDVKRLRAEVARVDASAHQTLERLRRAVSLLRDRDVDSADHHPGGDLRSCVEEVESALVAHGHPVEVDADRVTGLSAVLVSTLGRIVQAAGEQALASAPAGTPCMISVQQTPSFVRLRVSHEVGADPSPLMDGDNTALERLRLLGGEVDRSVVDGAWTLDAWVPLGRDAGARDLPEPPEDIVEVPTTWRMRIMQSLNPEWVGLLAALPMTFLAVRALVDVLVGATPASLDSVLRVTAWIMAALLLAVPRRFDALMLASGVLLLLYAVLRQPIGADMWLWITAGTVSVVRKKWFGTWVVLGLAFLAARGLTVVPMATAISFGMASWLFLAMGLAYGYFLQHRERLVTELERQRLEILDARAHERRLLAGELHDVVAHQLSLITMQAGALATTHDVPTLQRGLRRLAELNRSAESDLIVLKRVMLDEQAPGTTTDLHRQSVTGTADDVRNALRSAGLRPSINIDAESDALEPSTLHTVVRLLRECSTNMLRYAPPGGNCEISVSVEADRLLFRASNSMPEGRHVDSPLSNGLGLRGLAERISLQEGTFSAADVDGQWVVTADVPATGIE